MNRTAYNGNRKATNDERFDVCEGQSEFRDVWDPGEKGTFGECHSCPAASNLESPHAAPGPGNSRLGRLFRAVKQWVADALVLDMNPTLNDVVLNKTPSGKPTHDCVLHEENGKEARFSTVGSRTTYRNSFAPLPLNKQEPNANSFSVSLGSHSRGASHLWKTGIPDVKQQSFTSSQCNSISQGNVEHEVLANGECVNQYCSLSIPFTFLGSANALGDSEPRDAHDYEHAQQRASKESVVPLSLIDSSRRGTQLSRPAKKEVSHDPK